VFSPSALAVALCITCACALAQGVHRDEAAADAQVIESLRANGSDLTKPHPIRYYLYFTQEPSARAAASELERLWYKIDRLSPGPKKGQWGIIANKPTVPSMPVVSQITRDLNALAQRYQGEYDGWEAAVTK
jgi:hypothetical protein